MVMEGCQSWSNGPVLKTGVFKTREFESLTFRIKLALTHLVRRRKKLINKILRLLEKLLKLCG